MPGVADIFGNFEVEFDTTMVGGITEYNLGTGTQVANDTMSGAVYPQHLSINAQKPVASFSTVQIARALDNCALTGTSIAGLGAGFKFYLYQHSEGSTRAGASSHRKLTINEGIIVPTSLTCDHQGDATLSYDIVLTYNGTNDIIVLADSQSVPTVQGDTERFSLGKVTLESVLLESIRNLTINFGIDAVSEGADSEIWDRYASIRSIKPSLSLTGIDPEWLAAANIPLIGKAATHTNTAIYLRKRAQGSTFETDGTAEHIKFTAAGLAHIETPAQVTGDTPAETTLTMPLRYDGTNAPLIIDTASAIT